MLGYCLSVVRRLALPVLATGMVLAVAMTAAPVLGDGPPWREAAFHALAADAAVAFTFTAVLTITTAVGAAHTARRYGLTLAPKPCPCPP